MQSLLFHNRYRVSSARYPGWNYNDATHYFVTIVTDKRAPFFGEINNGQMVLSSIGAVVFAYWQDIPNHFSSVRLDTFVVMPNHIHGILEIKPHDGYFNVNRRDEAVPRLYNNAVNEQMSTISPKSGSLASIIGSYKSICTKSIHTNIDHTFAWQSRYHDRIIRDELELGRIRKYVQENPMKWETDDYVC